MLLPLAIAPSQWEPLVPVLSQHYCTITIGGPFVGAVATLEGRVRSSYGDVVKRLVETLHLQAGEAVLDVGCGPGAIARWLARQTKGANRIVGVDVNRYLINEAIALTRKEGLADAIPFRKATPRRCHLPRISLMRPGCVAVIVRAIDMSWWVNLATGRCGTIRSKRRATAYIFRPFQRVSRA